MKLFSVSKIDEYKTAKNVENFLNTKLPKLLIISGQSINSISSKPLDLAPSHGNINNTDNFILKSMEASQVVKAIHYAIYMLPDISKKIIIYKYIKYFNSIQICNSIGYSDRQTLRLKNKALCQFADMYNYTQSKLDISKENLIDLNIYK